MHHSYVEIATDAAADENKTNTDDDDDFQIIEVRNPEHLPDDDHSDDGEFSDSTEL